MAYNLSYLGNVEVYPFLTERNEKQFKEFEKLLNVELDGCFRNAWDKNIVAENVKFDPASLFNDTMTSTEEVLIQYLIGDNLLTFILLQKSIIARITFRTFFALEVDLHDFLSYALNKCKLIVIGFELEFNYAEADKVFERLSKDEGNYPFLIKEGDRDFITQIKYKADAFKSDALVEKTSFILNYFSNR